jgi:hypothetical protein
LAKPDQRDRGAGFRVPPQHFFRHAFERFFPPRHGAAVDQDFIELGCTGGEIDHVVYWQAGGYRIVRFRER